MHTHASSATDNRETLIFWPQDQCMPTENCSISWDQYKYKSWLTPTDCAMCCVTPSYHQAVHKAGCWVWSTGDGRRSTVDNTWWSTCCREIILSSEVGEKLQRELCLCLEIFEICIFLNKYSPHLLQATLSPRPEALDPVEARPWTMCNELLNILRVGEPMSWASTIGKVWS